MTGVDIAQLDSAAKTAALLKMFLPKWGRTKGSAYINSLKCTLSHTNSWLVSQTTALFDYPHYKAFS